MRICIVPMKPLAHAKARLAPVLSPDERRSLSLAMLTDVVRAAGELDVVWVLNSDDDAADAARAAGGEPRPDPAPGEGLNASLDAATAQATVEGARGVLVLSADCPAATRADVKAIAMGDGVVMASERYGTGPNAVWTSPSAAVHESLGRNSQPAYRAPAHGQH